MTSCPLLLHAVFLMSRDNLQISKNDGYDEGDGGIEGNVWQRIQRQRSVLRSVWHLFIIRNDTEPLYEHYRPNGCENQNSSYADKAQDNPYSNDPQAAHDIHTSDDLYGSIQDLFDEYDRNNL